MADKTIGRIGFVATRLSGTDGVSLEVVKWVDVLTKLGHESFFFAGEIEWPKNRSHLVPEAHFEHADSETINRDLFDDDIRSPETSALVQKTKEHLKKALYAFIEKFDINLLVAQNALAIPMNVPLGLAITEVVAETSIPIIGHHHDFAWERTRFAVTAAADYLDAAFPPTLPSVRHVVINSFAAQQLAVRTGVSSMLVPNVMDFENPPPAPDGYADELRADLDIADDALLILQPTRIVARKRIERAIELVRRLDRDCALVISHQSGDEGNEYEDYLKDYAELMGVRVIFGSDRISDERGETDDGKKIYSLADIYQCCDFVTYPSVIEGFGNAFLEAIYYHKPLVMCNYAIFKTDIQPKGFKVIAFDDFVTTEAVHETEALMGDPERITSMVEHNYDLARRFYSYHALETRLVALLNDCLGT